MLPQNYFLLSQFEIFRKFGSVRIVRPLRFSLTRVRLLDVRFGSSSKKGGSFASLLRSYVLNRSSSTGSWNIKGICFDFLAGAKQLSAS